MALTCESTCAAGFFFSQGYKHGLWKVLFNNKPRGITGTHPEASLWFLILLSLTRLHEREGSAQEKYK